MASTVSRPSVLSLSLPFQRVRTVREIIFSQRWTCVMEAYWNTLWLRDVSVLFPLLLGPTSNSSFCFHSWDTRPEVNDGESFSCQPYSSSIPLPFISSLLLLPLPSFAFIILILLKRFQLSYLKAFELNLQQTLSVLFWIDKLGIRFLI